MKQNNHDEKTCQVKISAWNWIETNWDEKQNKSQTLMKQVHKTE